MFFMPLGGGDAESLAEGGGEGVDASKSAELCDFVDVELGIGEELACLFEAELVDILLGILAVGFFEDAVYGDAGDAEFPGDEFHGDVLHGAALDVVPDGHGLGGHDMLVSSPLVAFQQKVYQFP